MTDTKLKLPLHVDAVHGPWGTPGKYSIYVRDVEGTRVALSCWVDGETTNAGAVHRAEIIVAALTADEEKPAVVVPSVDYTKIPQTYEGDWVLIDIKNQRVVSAASTPDNAMEGFDPADSNLILTKVPNYTEKELNDG